MFGHVRGMGFLFHPLLNERQDFFGFKERGAGFILDGGGGFDELVELEPAVFVFERNEQAVDLIVREERELACL